MKKEDQDLRERTKDFALPIIRMFTTLPRTPEAQILGKQVLRSGTSVGANYREAYRGRSKAEFVAKCGDCLRDSKKPPTGSNCWSIQRLSSRINWPPFAPSATN